MSSSERPASATAARQASSVRSSSERPSRRPTAEVPTPVSATASSNRAAEAGRGMRTTGSGRCASIGGSPGGLEQRQPDVLDRGEHHPDGQPHPRLVGRDPDQSAGETDLGRVRQGDDHDRVRLPRHSGPGVLVDRDRHNMSVPADLNHRQISGRTPRAELQGRVQVPFARRAVPQAEHSVGTGGPEEPRRAVGRRQGKAHAAPRPQHGPPSLRPSLSRRSPLLRETSLEAPKPDPITTVCALLSA